MVRFSCFHSHIHEDKQKKSVQLSAEAMHKMLEDRPASQALRNSTCLAMANPSHIKTNPSHFKMEGDTLENSVDQVTDSSPIEKDWKSEDIEWKSNNEFDIGINRSSCIMKSRSLGSGLDRKGKVSGGNESEDEADKRFSCSGSLSHCALVVLASSKDFGISMPDQFQEVVPSDSFQENSEVVNIESTFSIAHPQQSEKKVQEICDLQLSGAGECSDHTPCTPPIIEKSNSLPNMHSPVHHSACSLRCSRSAEDLNVLDSRCKAMSAHEIGTHVVPHEERDDSALKKNSCENFADYSCDAYNYVSSAKDWIIPVVDNVDNKDDQRESAFCRWDELPSKTFKIKRIEEWVRDLQHCSSLEETSTPSASDDHEVPKEDTVLDSSPAARLDGKASPSMEAVKKYISSLSATSTAAQLKNHGLVVIPFLSAFTSLRALNLSGNAIVRITAGSLPRGLHVLNLSKNNISNIEGLRELARLRVLDLSYNRLLRIGHGLASCSSLKELYLAGNKISEVEGVHRLLKLNVLDLRFNKISTTKCLGQLAANYNSLQAISLEGNPAQKNIGDEQLKKYLQGLLPNLAYYNRQPIKVGTLKDVADRSTRLGINSHQIERSHRPDLKTIWKGTHGAAAHKTSSSSIHTRRSQAVALSKGPRSRNGRLPPSGTKTSIRHHFYNFSNKLLNSKLHLSIPRSRSEGTLGVL